MLNTTKIIRVYLLITLFSIGFANAQTIDTVKNIFNDRGHSSPFTFLRVNINKTDSTKVPLIVFFHGAGERGSDNKTQLTVGLPKLVSSIIEAKKSCCIIVVQCPKDMKWVDTDWTLESHKMNYKETWTMTAAMKLINVAKIWPENIDTTRIYVTGISMGGFATWEVLQRYPNLFAAAIPICGGGDLEYAAKLKNMPIWAFHGKEDKTVKPLRTINMVNAIKKAGGKAKMTILENQDHACWDKVYEDANVINWLFSNKRNGK